MSNEKAIVFIFTSDGMGNTRDQELREILAGTMLRLLEESGSFPKAICFYTDGVKLACVGSPILKELAALEARGVPLVLCNTCLRRFGLEEKNQVGIMGGMTDILTAMVEADRVISL